MGDHMERITWRRKHGPEALRRLDSLRLYINEKYGDEIWEEVIAERIRYYGHRGLFKIWLHGNTVVIWFYVPIVALKGNVTSDHWDAEVYRFGVIDDDDVKKAESYIDEAVEWDRGHNMQKDKAESEKKPDNVIWEILNEEENVLQDLSRFSELLAEKLPGELFLQRLILLCAEEGMPGKMKEVPEPDFPGWVRQLMEISGCTEKTAENVVWLWYEAVRDKTPKTVDSDPKSRGDDTELPAMGMVCPPIDSRRSPVSTNTEKPDAGGIALGMATPPQKTGAEPSEGKEKCRALKDIRRQIAAANGIPFSTEICTYKGPCKGTCPKCDEEIRYLGNELKKKQERGEAIHLAGIAETAIKGFVDRPVGPEGDREEAHMGDIPLEPPVDGMSTGWNIESLGLSSWTCECLKRSGIYTTEDLCEMTEGDLLRVRGLGSRRYDEIIRKLEERGLQLKGDGWEGEEPAMGMMTLPDD